MADRANPEEILPTQTRARLVELIAAELRSAWDAAISAGGRSDELARMIDDRRRRLAADLDTMRCRDARQHEPDLRIPVPRHPRDDVAMVDSGFVGRTDELRRMMAALRAAAGGRPTTVLLAGEPGVGKSRLLGEYGSAARAWGAQVLLGGCVHLGAGEVHLGAGDFPYAPLIEALRLFVREQGEQRAADLAGPAWAELHGMIADFTDAAPQHPDAAPQHPPAARPHSDAGSQRQVFGSVMRLLDHLGSAAPVLMVFEDLHWADPSTLGLVSYLTRAKTDQRLVLVCSFRTELAKGHPLRRLLIEPDFTRRTERIEVHCFTEAELRQFLRVLGPVDHDLVHRGYELSGGNAFFAEQLYVTLSAGGDGRAAVPESLRELMSSRIDLPSGDATKLLRVAAAAGRRVSDLLLARVSGLDDEALDEALRTCLDAGLLVADQAGEAYLFHHALLRETVYGQLLPRERRRLHLSMAEAISVDPSLSLDETLASVELAYHWFEAGRKPEALSAAVQAGAANARIRAFREAEIQYKRALQLWPEVPDAAEVAGVSRDVILVAVADAARWAGHAGQAVEFALGAIAQIDPEREPRRAAELYERLGSYQWEAGATTQSTEAFQRAHELLADCPPDGLTARVLADLATARLREGDYSGGLHGAMEAIRLADEVGAPAEKGRALNTAGVALTMLDRPEEGVAHLRAALRIAEDTEHLEDLLRTYGNLALALEHSGALADSAAVARKGLALARRLGLGDARQGGILANNAGAALSLLGRWDEALELLDDALLIGPPVRASTYLRLTRAEIAVARGWFDDARRLLAEVSEQQNFDPRFLEPLFACAAELALWQGDVEAAQAAVDRGVAAVADSSNVLVRLRLYAVGLRAAADGWHAGGDHRRAERCADKLLDSVRTATAQRRRTPEVVALQRLCDAERGRVGRDDDAEAWRAVAACWDELSRPYAAAYARWREAAAAHAAGDAVRATRVALQAQDAARDLAAAPLATAVAELLAAAAGGPVATVSLTRREVEVLELLAAGETYRIIAKTLGISPKTASTHVHNVLKKLGVKSRAEAAAWVHQHGLPDPGTALSSAAS
jgi:DNA-binding CsgD family transcriptional regulator